MILLRSFRPNFALVKSSRCWFSGGVSKNIPTFPLARSTWNPHKATRCFLMFVVFEDVFCWKNVPILIGMRHNCQSGLKPTTLFCSLPWPHRTIIFCTCAAASRSTSIKKRERIGNSLWGVMKVEYGANNWCAWLWKVFKQKRRLPHPRRHQPPRARGHRRSLIFRRRRRASSSSRRRASSRNRSSNSCRRWFHKA